MPNLAAADESRLNIYLHIAAYVVTRPTQNESDKGHLSNNAAISEW